MFMARRYSYGVYLCKRKLRERRKSLVVHEEGEEGRKAEREGEREGGGRRSQRLGYRRGSYEGRSRHADPDTGMAQAALSPSLIFIARRKHNIKHKRK